MGVMGLWGDMLVVVLNDDCRVEMRLVDRWVELILLGSFGGLGACNRKRLCLSKPAAIKERQEL